MKRVVKESWKKIWEWLSNQIAIYFLGVNVESDIPENREEIIEQYSIVKWNMNRLYEGVDDEVMSERTLVVLHDLAERTRLQALRACGSSVTEYELRYMNGILRDMSVVVDELERLLHSVGNKDIRPYEDDRTLSYLLRKTKYAQTIPVVHNL